MNFIQLHDQDGLEVLVNLNQVEAILELPDGGCCFVFVCRMRMKKNRSFYSVETYKQVLKELGFFSGVPLLNFPLSEGRDIAKKVKCYINLPEDRIAGYCPNCDGTVDIKLTPLIKLKGHRCSWCGQAIDLSGVDNFMFRTAGTNFYDTDAYQLFAAGGAKMLFMQGAMPSDNITSFQMLDVYLDAKMQWDTTQDINELTQRWFKAMFKEAADVMFDLYVQENIGALVVAHETKKIAQTGIINYSVGREYWGYEMLNGWLDKIDTAWSLIEKYKTNDPDTYKMLKEHIDIEWVCPAYYMVTCNADSLSDDRYNELVTYFKTNISALRDFRLSEKSTATIGTWSSGLSLR